MVGFELSGMRILMCNLSGVKLHVTSIPKFIISMEVA